MHATQATGKRFPPSPASLEVENPPEKSATKASRLFHRHSDPLRKPDSRFTGEKNSPKLFGNLLVFRANARRHVALKLGRERAVEIHACFFFARGSHSGLCYSDLPANGYQPDCRLAYGTRRADFYRSQRRLQEEIRLRGKAGLALLRRDFLSAKPRIQSPRAQRSGTTSRSQSNSPIRFQPESNRLLCGIDSARYGNGNPHSRHFPTLPSNREPGRTRRSRSRFYPVVRMETSRYFGIASGNKRRTLGRRLPTNLDSMEPKS